MTREPEKQFKICQIFNTSYWFKVSLFRNFNFFRVSAVIILQIFIHKFALTEDVPVKISRPEFVSFMR